MTTMLCLTYRVGVPVGHAFLCASEPTELARLCYDGFRETTVCYEELCCKLKLGTYVVRGPVGHAIRCASEPTGGSCQNYRVSTPGLR